MSVLHPKAAAVVFAVAGLAAFPVGAIAQEATLRVRPAGVHQGDEVRLSGSAARCGTGNEIALISRAFSRSHQVAGVPAVMTRIREDGRFSTRTKIPRYKRSGRYTVTARCGGANLGVKASLYVF